VRKKEPLCPLLNKACVGDACMFWTHIMGHNPQTGHPVDQFDCSIRWLPMLMLENAKQTRGAQAAVESMRNEVVQRQDALNNAVALGQRQQAKQIGEQEWTTERLPKAT
jgi:hypothetical protein